MCEIYWEKTNTVSDPHPFLGGQWPVPNFEIGSEKNERLGELKGYLHYKTILCHKVALDEQLMIFSFEEKIMSRSRDI